MANGNDNQVDSLKLGIEIGGLDNSQIKNLKDLNNTLGNLDKILTSDFVKRLEVLSNIKINVDTGRLNQLNNQIKETATATENVKEIVSGGIVSAEIEKDTSGIEKLKKELENLQKEKNKYIKDYKKGLENQLGGLTPEFFDKVIDQDKKYQETIKNYSNSIEDLKNKISEKQSNAKQTIEEKSSQETLKTVTEITNKEQLYIAKLDLVKSKLKDTKLSEEQRVRLSGQRLSLEEKLSKLKNKEIKDDEKTTKEQKKSSGFLGKFGKTLGRIALYRAIRAILKTITQTIRQGAQALAQFSPQFNETMTQLTSAGKNLAMSFTSAFAPIIQSVTPFIVNLANTITNINNKIAEAISYMKGIGTYTKVNTEYQEEYNKTVNKLSFDKFDVLQQEGYGGFEEAEVDTEKMAENASIFENIKSVVETLKTAFSSFIEALKPLWEMVTIFADRYGDAITSVLKGIVEVAGKIWNVFGSIINVINIINNLNFTKGIFYSTLRMVLGVFETIKGVVASLLDLLNAVLRLDFSNIGKKLRENFNFGTSESVFAKAGQSFINLFKYGHFATGGVPDSGSLFLAGEAGAELVGTMSGGRTGVMNMEQMENAVKKGMIEAYSLFANRRTESSETINVNISDETLFTAVRKTAKRRGFDFANV